MPTRAGWLVVATGFITVGLGRVLGLPELYLLGACAAVLVPVAWVMVRRPVDHLVVTRTLRPARVPMGQPSRVELQITNHHRRRSPVMVLHDPVEGTVGVQVAMAPLAPGEQQVASYRLPTNRRGLVSVGPLEGQLSDPFGLVRRRVRLTGIDTLTVLPAFERLRRISTGGGLDDPLAGATRTVVGSTAGEEFASLRSYVAGDDMRRVHWSSSARAGELLVRQDDPPWQGHLTVMLDARTNGIDAPNFEVAVSAAASLVQAVAERGDRIRLIITDGTDSGLVDARRSRDMLLEHLALVVRHDGGDLPIPPLDGRRRTGELVVVSGAVDQLELDMLQSCLPRFARLRLVLVRPQPAVPAPTADLEVLVIPAGGSFAPVWHASAIVGARS